MPFVKPRARSRRSLITTATTIPALIITAYMCNWKPTRIVLLPGLGMVSSVTGPPPAPPPHPVPAAGSAARSATAQTPARP